MTASYQLIGARESRDASAHNDYFLSCAAALVRLPGFQRSARDSGDRAPDHLDHVPPLHQLRLLKSNVLPWRLIRISAIGHPSEASGDEVAVTNESNEEDHNGSGLHAFQSTDSPSVRNTEPAKCSTSATMLRIAGG